MPYDNNMHKTFIRKIFIQKKIEIFYNNVTLLNPSNLLVTKIMYLLFIHISATFL